MITRQKVLLVTKAPSVAKFVARFEAVKAISDVSQIFEVWENNKTPLILGTAVADCPIIYCPKMALLTTRLLLNSVTKEASSVANTKLVSNMMPTKSVASSVNWLPSKECQLL